ncbi:putative protein kinase CAMK-CAMKL-CHK1 family [Helianthus annuus]|uniref:Protein kinase domain-containing protein n=1 Tax=Helianthus annuus TaxID=4232 RepID=A0A9K3IU05_HELAN|nr:putative protein kinase CAMK-CAMKL-CHK1 family [Helianthus annuus]
MDKQRIVTGGLAAHVKREIAAMRRLNHPNIVRMHEVLANQKKIYFVLEFAPGGDLFSKVAKCRFSEDLSRRYFQQLVSAVRYCHSRGVYHRDLKLENLLLDENWNLKVTDFGLSVVTHRSRSPSDTDGLVHTMCGTPAYVAPEILAKKGYDGAKVDIWACGVILYVLSTGYLPFNESNVVLMYLKICKGEYTVPKWMSPELKQFLSRLLDTNPQTRITIDEIIKDPWFRIGVVEAAEQERLRVAKKNKWWVKVDGCHSRNFTLMIEVKRLTVDIVVVDVSWKECESNRGPEIWKSRLRPRLSGLIYQPDGLVRSN